MRFAVAPFAFFALFAPSLAQAQLTPPPPMQPQPTPAPTAPWNPFLPQAPQNQPYGQYAGPSATQQQLNASAASDSGRGLEVAWANVEGGGSDLTGKSSTGGLTLGVGAGARFVLFSLGARVRVSPYKDFTLLQFLGEGGFHLPLGMWDPYAKLRLGYAKTGDIIPGVSASGFDLGGAVGVDYYLSSMFSLGIEGGVDGLFFDSKAALLAGTAHVGVHFDL
jgi:hypothetical protein